MPSVSISAITYDPQGVLDLALTRPGEGIHDRTRRVARTQTLDGGAAFTDGGSTPADQTFVLRARLTKAEAEILKHLVETYRELFCSTPAGFYRVAPEQLTFDGNLALIRLLVIRKEEA